MESLVPRMLRSMTPLRHDALLIRGPQARLAVFSVPALRSSVKNAAPRPGQANDLAADVAVQLGISEGAVWTAKSHVLKRLRQVAKDLLD